MLTIRTKVIAASTGVFGMVLIVFAFIIYQRTGDAELAKLDARLESQAEKIATEIEEDSAEAVPPDIQELRAIRTGGLFGVRLRIIGADGRPLADDTALTGSPSSVASEVMRTGLPARRTLELAGGTIRSFWRRSDPDARTRLVVQLGASMDELQARQHDLLLLLSAVIPLALLSSAAAAWLIARSAFRPITRMIEGAERITAKNLDRRLELPPARDEIRALGDTFNRMIERIDRAFRSQQQFIADASHEIRTPLTVICSELESAEQRASDPALKENIQLSLSETDRLSRLADGLLLLARLDASQVMLSLEPVRMDELLAECAQLVGSMAARRGIALRIDIADPTVVQADREKLKSVILNLVGNAVKYSDPGKTVTLSLAPASGRPGGVALTVQDCGIGIPKEALGNIFDRFYRVDASRSGAGGHGLGLAIARQLVELHGGTIRVVSEVGKGSSFTVELPSRPVP